MTSSPNHQANIDIRQAQCADASWAPSALEATRRDVQYSKLLVDQALMNARQAYPEAIERFQSSIADARRQVQISKLLIDHALDLIADADQRCSRFPRATP